MVSDQLHHDTRKHKTSIAIVGVYPPPLGGISVHIKRLSHILKARGIPFVIIDGSGEPKSPQQEDSRIIDVPTEKIERWCLRYLFQRNEKIVFNHFLRWKVRFFLSLLKLKGVRVVHTVHSYRSAEQFSALERMMIKLTGRLSDHFIAVTDEVKDRLLKVGVPEHKISVIPAFIPPDETEAAVTNVPDDVWSFFDRHEQVIVANGGIGNLYNGADLYGADLCVESFIRLAREHPRLGYVFGITHVVDDTKLTELRRRLDEAGLAERFLWVHEQMPLYPLLRRAALFVRPTNSDGDALSIREALYAGTPVVTSDVVKRPAGVITFRNRDADDFTAKCHAVLAGETNGSVHEGLPQSGASEQAAYVEQVIRILLHA